LELGLKGRRFNSPFSSPNYFLLTIIFDSSHFSLGGNRNFSIGFRGKIWRLSNNLSIPLNYLGFSQRRAKRI